jgi:hypothetical protein
MKICKENSLLKRETAHLWMKLYKTYMIYLAWKLEDEISIYPENKDYSNILQRANYLCVPYEVLQVWKLHALYTHNYQEFSSLITDKKLDFIDFIIPYNIWVSQDIFFLYKYFEENKYYTMSLLDDQTKNLSKNIYIFQSSYIKNILNFNILDGTPTDQIIVEAFRKELKPMTYFEDVTEMKPQDLIDLVSKAQNIFSNCIYSENIAKPKKWEVKKEFLDDELVKKMLTNLDLIELPVNFVNFFSRHHLINHERANMLIDEYKRYMFLSVVTREMQTPSEEVDQVWHYHMSHSTNYLNFCRKVLNFGFFHHNPSDGKPGAEKIFRNVYQETRDNIEKYFGEKANELAWPNTQIRFSKFYKWKTFYYYAKLAGLCLFQEPETKQSDELSVNSISTSHSDFQNPSLICGSTSKPKSNKRLLKKEEVGTLYSEVGTGCSHSASNFFS